MTQKSTVRVRFAPSPTGPLHIGGVRTALYNYLYAKKMGGSFILRIEDTDQKRYVKGAEAYIQEALDWLGLSLDEGPKQGGDFGPYRQSERSELYQKFAEQLVTEGKGYYAFDTPEELNAWKEKLKLEGEHSPKYGHATRMSMSNSLTLNAEEVKAKLDAGTPHVIRFKIEPGQSVKFVDLIRGEVEFSSDELDDKVMMKADGLPTYHLANIVDDHHMEISHVIRGEEWLSSTALHTLLYRAFGWEETKPKFAHLPLINNPDGKGKLSKRHGKKFGFPVFPIDWIAENEEDNFIGFREMGFDPAAVINFLAFLGWNPGTEQEIFSLAELAEAFSIERINKSGARFDFDKAKWYNQQYIAAKSDEELANIVQAMLKEHGIDLTNDKANLWAQLLKDRVEVYPHFYSKGKSFVGDLEDIDYKTFRKKYKEENVEHFQTIKQNLDGLSDWTTNSIANLVKSYMEEKSLSFGAIFPILRIALSGSTKGPDLFGMMELLGKDVVLKRLNNLDAIASQAQQQ
jgi:glutamyl-tRNA synthetase